METEKRPSAMYIGLSIMQNLEWKRMGKLVVLEFFQMKGPFPSEKSLDMLMKKGNFRLPGVPVA